MSTGSDEILPSRGGSAYRRPPEAGPVEPPAGVDEAGADEAGADAGSDTRAFDDSESGNRGPVDPPTNPWWARPTPTNLTTAFPSQVEPSQVEPSQVEPSQVEPSQVGPSQVGPSQVGPGPQPVAAGHGRSGTVAAILLAGLLGGAAGGVIGAHTTRADDIRTGLVQGAPVTDLITAAPAPVERTAPISTIAAHALPSVVTITVISGVSAATGSGVIIRSDGYILTNNHVVAGGVAGGRVSVTLYKELRQISAEIIGCDPKTDLAVIRIRTPDLLPAATLGRSGSLMVGAPLVAIGAPLGLSGTVTTGIVSALDRNPTVPGESGGESVLIGAIQTDAAINPGNSGGPLLDGRGQVVGINTAIAAVPGSGAGRGASGSIGVGFAIPIDYASSVAEEIIRTGRATHPYLGVSAGTVTPDEAQASGTSPGALVRGVDAGGPGDQAGLRPGDIIIKVDDVVVGNTNDLIAATRVHKIGDRVTVTFQRDRRSQSVEIALQEQHD
ncbi:trypsin-like peptidase domain-containing protein [Frankia sp. Cppng1_Ct_nod]|uniref:trypsin-like peptidase domain-containing protein n=1 Tax=Frankia sp. Cppng1_Ct_nod TaxID=2897162 RepID=UPI001F5EA0F5|nr:trypsin-like peptidase domain-containing protein [Frankia sp. Cppng1_Ct_nod]